MEITGGRFRAALLIGAAASLLAFASGARAQDKDDHDSHSNIWPYAMAHKSPVLAVVGDVSCQEGGEVSGEAGHEVCTDPKSTKGNYANASNTSLWQSQEGTANQIENIIKPDVVALLGDLQYQAGLYSDFEASFDLTYGAFKFLHRPAPGNHEFYDEHSETGVAGYGYFSYYNGFQIDANGNQMKVTISDPCPSNLLWTESNAPSPVPMPYPASPCGNPGLNTPFPQPVPRADGQAGHFEGSGGLGAVTYYNGPLAGTAAPVGNGEGWYSYNLGSWHLISLNAECSTQQLDGCPARDLEPSANTWLADQLAWLKKDLDENHAPCTLAYWHQPTFSATNSISPEGVTAKLFWQILYDHKADLVLNGHDHLYARYQPLTPEGTADPDMGIREFIVGTGGETLDPIVTTPVTKAAGTTASPETNQEDPSGNINFNSTNSPNSHNLEAYTGDYWGVMALRLDPNGYHWDFESTPGLGSPTASFDNGGGPGSGNNGPTFPPATVNGYSDTGFGFCHNSPDRSRHDDDDDRDHDHDHDR